MLTTEKPLRVRSSNVCRRFCKDKKSERSTSGNQKEDCHKEYPSMNFQDDIGVKKNIQLHKHFLHHKADK